jgi:hypothetical protein
MGLFTLVNKKETDFQLSHTDVYKGEQYLGYFLPNKSQFSAVDENWNFVSRCECLQHFPAKSKKELLITLSNQYGKEN